MCQLESNHEPEGLCACSASRGETEVSDCKQQQLWWYNVSQGPMWLGCQELQQGRPGCQQLGWEESKLHISLCILTSGPPPAQQEREVRGQ